MPLLGVASKEVGALVGAPSMENLPLLPSIGYFLFSIDAHIDLFSMDGEGFKARMPIFT